jgi:hypothetical protein
MTTTTSSFTAIVCGLGALCGLASCASSPRATDGVETVGMANAAVEYRAIWDRYAPQLAELETRLESKTIVGGKQWAQSSNLPELVGGEWFDAYIDRLIAASAIERCDFQIDLSAGPETLLTHLAPLRQSIAYLVAAARMADDAGQTERADRCYNGAITMCVHMSRERVYVSRFAAANIFRGVSCVFLASSEGRVRRELVHTRSTVLRLMKPDPFGLVDGLVADGDFTGSWILRLAESREGRERSAQFLTRVEPETEELRKLRRMLLDGEDMSPVVAGFRTFYEEVRRVADESGTLEEFAAIEERASQGEFGVLARCMLLSPSLMYKHYTWSWQEVVKLERALGIHWNE